jgi:crotonobetainyl-CoA:carnitine CoA-transferase CaiB-like acyl-CoA transferase
MPAAALAHLRVVDLTDLRGALAGRILADLGADVLKVEPPGGDPGRLTPPFAGNVTARDRSLPFLFRNLGKRGAVIDLDDAAGRERLTTILARADVLLENLDASDPRREGLAPDAVRARHPHLVHVAIADLGRAGPRAGWRLEPLPAFAASGAHWASGFADRAPCWLPGFQAHDCAAVAAVTAALAALIARSRHGHGDTVEVSVQEAAMASLAPWGIPLVDYARRFPVLPASYPRDADGPAVVVPVADGWVRVLAVTPRQLRAFTALLAGFEPPERRAGTSGGGSSWVSGPALGALAGRGAAFANAILAAVARLPVRIDGRGAAEAALATLRAVATRALAGRPRDQVLAHGLRLGLPIAPVHRPEEFVAAEQTRVRGFFRRTGFPHLGDAPVAPFPCNLSATPVALTRPSPAPGADDGDFATPPAAPPGGDHDGEPPLTGLRVVTLGVGAVVPELCGMLRDLGAEVVKIESAVSPDFLRRLTVDFASPNHSFMFNDENRGQQSVCIDGSTATGRALALRLCATADVVTENRQGGLAERLGLGYDAVRALRPDVVYVSSQGYGRTGPLGTAPAFGPMAAAFAGATWLWNHPGAPYPAGSSLEHPDHFAGRLLAVAVLAALEHRRRTGQGQYVELAQSEAAAFLLGPVYLEEPLTGRRVVQRGNASEAACPHGVYPASGPDEWVAVAAADDAAWGRFHAALGWPEAQELATLAGRLAVRDALDARVAAWTRDRSAEDAAARLQAAGVSAFPVQGPAEHRADPHLAARAALVRLDDPGVDDVLHVANPLRFGRATLMPPAPAPRLGADTETVLGRLLGMSPDAVRRLVAEGVCR